MIPYMLWFLNVVISLIQLNNKIKNNEINLDGANVILGKVHFGDDMLIFSKLYLVDSIPPRFWE